MLICLVSMGANAQNPKPFVVPELQEWDGKTGSFIPGENPRVVYDNPILQDIANRFAEDYKLMFGVQPAVLKENRRKEISFLQQRKIRNWQMKDMS